jgi:L-iditol 2-dehydrogenase
MKAIVLEAAGKVACRDLPMPEVPSGWALIRVGWCGVCGSDMPRMFTKGAHRMPLVCGHEMAGVIAALGPDTAGAPVGDRAVVFPLIWCGACAACEVGAYVQCEAYDYLGSRRDGGFAEYVAAPVRNLLPVPPNVSLASAAMTEPAAVALHALRTTGLPLVGRDVAVFGAGPIGLLTAQWARIMGAKRVFISDVVAAKLEMALGLGFEYLIDATEQSAVEAIREITHGAGVAVAVEAAGVPQTLLAAIRSVGRGGRVTLLGNPSADVTLPAELISRIMRQEIALCGVWNSTYSVLGGADDWRAVLNAMAAGTLDAERLVSHRASLSAAPDLLRAIHARTISASKVLVGAPIGPELAGTEGSEL